MDCRNQGVDEKDDRIDPQAYIQRHRHGDRSVRRWSPQENRRASTGRGRCIGDHFGHQLIAIEVDVGQIRWYIVGVTP